MIVEIEVNEETLKNARDIMRLMPGGDVPESDVLTMQKIKNIIGMMHFETLGKVPMSEKPSIPHTHCYTCGCKIGKI